MGTWRGGDLAVKCVRVAKESEASSFLREVACLAAIRHPNVMQFYGVHSRSHARLPVQCTVQAQLLVCADMVACVTV